MKPQISFTLLGLALFSMAAFAEQKDYAPLPEKVVAAKTVMLVNESGTSRFGDDLCRQIKAWNRWQVVTDKGKADLVLVLSPSDTVPVVVSTASATASGQTVYGSGVTAHGNMEPSIGTSTSWMLRSAILASLFTRIEYRIRTAFVLYWFP
jgi:hypothetical protein